jgi:DNA-binding GntR family transcriptional regulator
VNAVTYAAIADHYKKLIADRVIQHGQRLPSVRKLAQEWNTSPTTAARALNALCAEGWARAIAGSGHEAAYRVHEETTLRVTIQGVRPRGEQLSPDDKQEIISAGWDEHTGGLVADILGIEAGTRTLVRRGRVLRGGRVIRASSSIYLPEFAELVPEALIAEPCGTVALFEQRSGRRTEVTADHWTVDVATLPDAERYGVRSGEPLLVRTTTRHDGHGVIEYGRTVWPRGVVVAYEYTDVDPQ